MCNFKAKNDQISKTFKKISLFTFFFRNSVRKIFENPKIAAQI